MGIEPANFRLVAQCRNQLRYLTIEIYILFVDKPHFKTVEISNI